MTEINIGGAHFKTSLGALGILICERRVQHHKAILVKTDSLGPFGIISLI